MNYGESSGNRDGRPGNAVIRRPSMGQGQPVQFLPTQLAHQPPLYRQDSRWPRFAAVSLLRIVNTAKMAVKPASVTEMLRSGFAGPAAHGGMEAEETQRHPCFCRKSAVIAAAALLRAIPVPGTVSAGNLQ
jgi:hypothetical protein